jgi:hypothetical protein
MCASPVTNNPVIIIVSQPEKAPALDPKKELEQGILAILRERITSDTLAEATSPLLKLCDAQGIIDGFVDISFVEGIMKQVESSVSTAQFHQIYDILLVTLLSTHKKEKIEWENAVFDLPDNHREAIALSHAWRNPNLLNGTIISRYMIDSEQMRFEILKIVLRNPRFTCDTLAYYFLKQFYITEVPYLSEIGEILIERKPYFFLNYFNKRGTQAIPKELTSKFFRLLIAKWNEDVIQGMDLLRFYENEVLCQEDLIELARNVAQRNGDLFYSCSKMFKAIKDKAQLASLVSKVYCSVPRGIEIVLEYLDQFPEGSRIQWAHIAAEQHPEYFLKGIKIFDISEVGVRIELIKKIIPFLNAYDLDNLCKHFDEWEIDDPKVRGDIASQIVEKDPWIIGSIIPYFKIDNEPLRISWAKIALKECPRTLAENFKVFAISDKALHVAFARELAITAPLLLAENISKFTLTDPSVRVELIYEVSKRGGLILSDQHDDMLKWDLPNPKMHAELAMIAIEQNPSNVTEFIERYHIQEEEERIQLARKAAILCPEKLASMIGRFHITDPAILAELAIGIAKKNGATISEFIDRWPISNTKALFDIAMLALQQNPFGVIPLLKNYKGLNEEMRVALAQLAMRLCPIQFCHHVRDFKLTTLEIRKELATAIAKRNVIIYMTSEMFFNNFGIPPKEREGINRLLLRHPSDMTPVPLISAFQSPLAACAEYLAMAGPHLPKAFYTSYIKHFGRCDQFPELYLLMSETYPSQFLSSLSELRLSLAQFKQCIAFFEKCERAHPVLRPIKERLAALYACVLDFSHSSPALAQVLTKWVASLDNKIDWMASFLIRCRTNGISADVVNKYFPIVQSLLSEVRDPAFRALMQDFLLDLLTSKEAQKHFDQASIDFKFNDPKFLLPLMMLSSHFPITKAMMDGIRGFTDGKNLRPLLQHLQLLLEEHRIPTAQKKMLVEKVIFGGMQSSMKKRMEHALNAAALISQCLILDQVSPRILDVLREVNSFEALQKGSSDPSLNEAFIRCFQLDDVEDFHEKYTKTIATYRRPEILFIYASKVQQLPKEEREKVFKALQDFVRGLLNGNLNTVRSDPSQSEHVRAIQERDPDLSKEWEKEYRVSKSNFTVINTHNGWLLFSMPSDGGTCQSTLAEPKYNKALLGYPLNWSTRMIALIPPGTDILEKSSVRMRCILRILWTDQGEAVIFREPIYPKENCRQEHRKAIEEESIIYARQLQRKLLAKEGDTPYPGTLRSFPGRAPFECVDALEKPNTTNHIVPGDKGYTISGAHLIST